ncbi:MAG: alpha/beta hydrolase [Lysobacter sp.]|nr:alpha/beta hydrolase [Lysobacter sp.]
MTARSNLLCFVLLLMLGSSAGSPCFAQQIIQDNDLVRIDTIDLPAPELADNGLRIRIFLPNGYDPKSGIGYPVLYLNDGQDAEAVALQATLDELMDRNEIRPLIAVAIDMPNNRIAAYGFSDRAGQHGLVSPHRAGEIGTLAHAYSEWVATRLVPAIDARYRTRPRPEARAILGWSLGGANALNLGWQYPEVFANVGAFSPSLWLSPQPDNLDEIQSSRFAQRMIAIGAYHAGSRFFFAVGDAEETDDRDRDGVIDVLDDTRDLIDGWREAEDGDHLRQPGLRQLGHSVNPDHAAKGTRADAALFVLAGGKHEQASWAQMLPEFLRWAYAVHAPPLNATGRTESWQRVPSRHVDARDIDVWLPPSYGSDPQRRYPVLYMHDGQNLFDPGLGYTGIDWDIDGAMTRLIEAGDIREAIVVGVWNTPLRFAEYMPKAPVRTGMVGSGIDGRAIGRAEDIRSDGYLRFLVDELKPFIDAQYRALPGREDTFVMGSSMGGLISAYAVAQYPDVFGGIGAVSTHWPACDGCVVDWLGAHLPDPRTHRLYFDHGTAGLDARYASHQLRMDAALRAGGYSEGKNLMSRRFEGADHNEAAWRARVEIPLRFLLAR